jgi:hypothetical protein
MSPPMLRPPSAVASDPAAQRSFLFKRHQDICTVKSDIPSYSLIFVLCRRRWLLCAMMLFSTLIFLTCLALSLALPQQKRQGGGPVIGSNFQDPSVVQKSDGTYVAYSGVNGNPAGINVLIASSSNFEGWTIHQGYDALPQLPSWAASPPHVWAPDVTVLVGLQLFGVL